MEEPILYKILRPIITFLFKLFYRPKVIGKENILNSGGLVLAGNHTSYFDCLLLISCTDRVIHFLAKDELSRGIFSPIFKKMGLIFVNRRQKDRESLSKGMEYLKDNKIIGIFPEGTINRTDEVIMPFKFGAVKMASETDSYMVPFTITGKYRLFKKSITIIFDKPYKVSNNLKQENKKLENIISQRLIKRS